MGKPHPNHPGEIGIDARLAECLRRPKELNIRAAAVEHLSSAGVPFVVGGAYAFASYTGIYRDTKDLDLFPRRADALRALEVLRTHGWRTERTDEVWIYKAFQGEYYVDLIFSSGNAVAEVDDEWFRYARRGEVFGHPTLIAPPEELIWSKAFVLERERYDGADVLHIIRGAGRQLDWNRLMRRFDRYWELLLSHLLLFRFAYPSDRSIVPDWVMIDLLSRAAETVRHGDWDERVCRGNLFSKVNYGVDIREWGYLDGRNWDEREREKEQRLAEGPTSEAESGRGR